MACELPVRGGHTALIDEEDWPLVSQHKWHLTGWHSRYVGTWVRLPGQPRRKTTLYLHRLIMRPPEGIEVDHISEDTLDNRRSNLRLVTRSQNEQAKRHATWSSTGARGVTFERTKTASPYRAMVQVNGKRINLGYFRTVEEAASAAARGRAKYMTHAPECGADK